VTITASLGISVLIPLWGLYARRRTFGIYSSSTLRLAPIEIYAKENPDSPGNWRIVASFVCVVAGTGIIVLLDYSYL
jgi:hypothetical protein